MGYTHYWRRHPQLDARAFAEAAADIKEVLAKLGQMGVKLAGPEGQGAMTITPERIAFNGVMRCGHQKRDLGITWPSPEKDAGGVGTLTKGQWFAGSLLMERTCGGDCSHESFYVDRVIAPKNEKADKQGRYFECCKTAYKPYDLAVTAALIILKRYLGNGISITSDGEDKDWRDAAMVCQLVLGYGANTTLKDLG